jgi:subtilisin family serine protease
MELEICLKEIKMKCSRRLLSFLLLPVLMTIPLFGQRSLSKETYQGKEVVANEVLIKLKPGMALRASEMRQRHKVDRMERLGISGIVRLHSSGSTVASLLASVSSRSDVAYAEPNYIVHAVSSSAVLTPDDPFFRDLWGLHNTGQFAHGATGTAGADIGAAAAWNITTGSSSYVVAGIDTGIDYNHPDLAPNVWSAPASFTVTMDGQQITCPAGSHGFNAITNICDPMDDNGHGTHTLGTVGAAGNNHQGVVGVNWITSLMAAKFLDASGSGSVSDAIKAIDFTIQAKAAFGGEGGGANVRVLNNSWGCSSLGGGCFSQALLDEIKLTSANNMLFAAAAGNSGMNTDQAAFFPADYGSPNIISVAATDSQDRLSWFSNYGQITAQIGAPGVAILSTFPNGSYKWESGTSMATPHVSGAAALILSACPTLDTAALKTLILGSADPDPSLQWKTTTGARLDVNKAVQLCTAGPDFLLWTPPPSQGVIAMSYPISMASFQGFSAPVSFSVSGLPPGASASFTPASLTGSGSTMLRVTTNSFTPGGFYPLTVTGTGGGVSHSVTETLEVGSTASLTAGNVWQSMAFAPQTGIFEAMFSASPSAAAPFSSGLVGISQGGANAESDLAVAVRFNSSGFIDASNGGVYAAESSIPFDPGNSFDFRFQIDLNAHTYSAYVTPLSGPEQVLALNYAFPAGQNAVTALDHLDAFAATGSMPVYRFLAGMSGPDFYLAQHSGFGGNGLGATVPGGNSASFTVDLTPVHGFGGNVALSLSGVPSGVTADLSPASLPGIGSTTLTFTASTSAQPGDYDVVITGTSGGITHSTVLLLQVEDYEIPMGTFSAITPGGSATANFVFQPLRMAPYDNFFLNFFSVDLGVTGLPSDATAILSPVSSIFASGLQPSDQRPGSLTVTTSKSTPPGTYPVTITGVMHPSSGNGPSHSTTVPLVVNPVDFTVSASPPLQTVRAGEAATYSATITASSGFHGTVTPAVTNLPAGSSAAFNPPTVNGSGISTLSINTSSLTPVGQYRLNVAGTSGTSSDSDSVTLAVTSPCLISGSTRQDTPIASQSGAFSAQFDVTPSASSINSIIGLSAGASGFTAMVEFDPSGNINAYDGNSHSFTAPRSIPYVGGQTYHFELDVDVASNTYSASVTLPGGNNIVLATSIRFRYKTAALDHWSAYAGPVTVCNFAVQSGDLKVSVAPASQTVAAGGATNYSLSNFSSEAAVLSVSGLPSGASASFSRNPIQGAVPITGLGSAFNQAGSSSLTVTTGSTTPPGTYPLAVTAANGNLVTSVSVDLVVTGSCITVADPWQNTAIASQSDIFTAQFDATPSVSPIRSVVGLAPAGGGVVAIVQFDPSGNINAYDGHSGSYTAATAIPYSAGQSYHFRLAVNIPVNTYSIYVTPPGGSELVIGTDYLLRHPVTSLDQWSADSTPGSTEVCNLTIL